MDESCNATDDANDTDQKRDDPSNWAVDKGRGQKESLVGSVQVTTDGNSKPTNPKETNEHQSNYI